MLNPLKQMNGWRSSHGYSQSHSRIHASDLLELKSRTVRNGILLLGFLLGACSLFGASAPSPETNFSGSAGNVLVWSDPLVGVKPASNPELLARSLRQSDYAVRTISTAELIESDWAAGTQNPTCLVLPYGSHFPAKGVERLESQLRRQGRVLLLGASGLREPLYRTHHGWMPRMRLTESTAGAVRLTLWDSNGVSRAVGQLKGAGESMSVTNCSAAGRINALRIEFPDLNSYGYVTLKLTNASRANILHFRARGDATTQQLCLEVNDQTGNEWKGLVPLSELWQTYELSAADFLYCGSDRTRAADGLVMGSAVRIQFGLVSRLAGKGKRAFMLADVEFRPTEVSEAESVASHSG